MSDFFKSKKHTYISAKVMIFYFLIVGIAFCIYMSFLLRNEKEQTQKYNVELAVFNQMVENEQKEIKRLKTDIESLTQQYEDLSSKKEIEKELFNRVYDNYINEIELYKKYAGFTRVSGEGIDIGIDDSQIIEKPDAYLVHDEYLAEIINVLKGAGARAIAINGQRVTAITECLCLGPSIRVNGVRLFAPYHIEAIGNPDELSKAFKKSNIYETMRSNDLIVDIVKKREIIIDKSNINISNAINELEVIE